MRSLANWTKATVAGAVLLLLVVTAVRVLRPERLAALDDLDVFPSPLAEPALVAT